MTDDFVKAWGPRKSAKSIARRKQALALEAASQRRMNARALRSFWQQQGAVEWGGGGGWGDTGTATWGPVSIHDDDKDNGGWDTGGGWDGGVTGWGGWGTGGGSGGGSEWALPADDTRLLKPTCRFPRRWGQVWLVRQPPTFFKMFERIHRAFRRVLRRRIDELRRKRHELRSQQPAEERRELRLLR
jgi:hypothetical protein